ncbi:MAG TPA: ABC transporter ATP-binding protein [Nitrososphaerales archaeon]|nr:ABC transporter ATP-binding protein [Nitrososphaerales archaeon]
MSPKSQGSTRASAVEVVDLTKKYGSGPESTLALRGVTFSVASGEFVAISGPSGSGKSTLLNAIGALDRPSSGRIFLEGVDISRLSSAELARIRNEKIGFVFQDFNLISRMSTVENVELPLSIRGVPPRERREKAMDLLERFGISDKARKSPRELSGGQRQRVAVARALSSDPSIILADEPTGNLDSQNATLTMDFLKRLNTDFGKTLLIITHDPDVASLAERTILMRDGAVERILEN